MVGLANAEIIVSTAMVGLADAELIYRQANCVRRWNQQLTVSWNRC
jgi:hypothetical protein